MENERPLCCICNHRKAKKISGKPGKFSKRCSICQLSPEAYARVKANKKKYRPQMKYRVFKKDSCEECGFVPVHPCQLDVDHIDGNHSNNDPSNLQTLCANCHRLKTWLAKDHLPRLEVSPTA